MDLHLDELCWQCPILVEMELLFVFILMNYVGNSQFWYEMEQLFGLYLGELHCVLAMPNSGMKLSSLWIFILMNHVGNTQFWYEME